MYKWIPNLSRGRIGDILLPTCYHVLAAHMTGLKTLRFPVTYSAYYCNETKFHNDSLFYAFKVLNHVVILKLKNTMFCIPRYRVEEISQQVVISSLSAILASNNDRE